MSDRNEHIDFEEEPIVEQDKRYSMVRDGVMVANDHTALREYEKYANIQRERHQEINRLRDDVDTLKEDMSDIKSMLTELVNAQNSKKES